MGLLERIEPLKTCRVCGESKPVSDFCKCSAAADRLEYRLYATRAQMTVILQSVGVTP